MSNIQGIGTDIIEIERIKQAMLRHETKFLTTLFTVRERDYCSKYSYPLPHYAGRFAAKEAILKVLGSGITPEIGWLDIEILNEPGGKPYVELSERLQKRFEGLVLHISISHCKEYATATAIGTVSCNTKN